MGILSPSNTSIKCLYTNAHRIVGNKLDELEIRVQSWGFELPAIIERWWESSKDWVVVVKDYTLFSRETPGGSGGGVALYVRKNGTHPALYW